MSEPMPTNSKAKKILAIIGVILALVLLASPFIPLYRIHLGSGEYVYANVINYYSYWSETKAIGFIVICSISAAIGGLAAFMYLRCLLAKPQADDKEDKFFVFGCAIFALASVLYGAITLSVQAYAAMFMGIAFGILGIAGLVLHYKVLSDI